MRCAVFGCNNHNKSNNFVSGEIRFHKFPKDNTSLWVNACCRSDKFNVVSARICSKHFKETDYEIPLQNKLLNYVPKHGFNLKSDAVPSLFLPKGKILKRNDERENRIKKRNIRKFVNSILQNNNEEVNDKGVSTIPSTTQNIPSPSTDDCSPLGCCTSSKIVPVPVPRSLKTVGYYKVPCKLPSN